MPALTSGPRAVCLGRRLRRLARGTVAAVVVAGFGAAASATGALAGSPVASPVPQVASLSACAVSGPLMGLAPYPGTRSDAFAPFVNLSATNGHGAYAGVSFTLTSVGASFTVVRRDPNGAAKVLGRFVYDNTVFDLVRSVRVIGMDPWGGVVVVVQRTNYSLTDDRWIGIRYDAAGVRHDLTSDPSWLAVQPIGVADSGSVVGTVTGPDRLRRVVIWRGQGSGSMTRLSAPGQVAIAFTANADWYDDGQTGFSAVQVHPHGGAPARHLAGLDGALLQNWPMLSGTSYDQVWGNDQKPPAGRGFYGVSARWGPGSTAGSTAPVPAVRASPFYAIAAVGRAGDAVGIVDPKASNTIGPLVLTTRSGTQYALPDHYTPPFDDPLPEVVDPLGRVVLTGASRVPVMVTCPQ